MPSVPQKVLVVETGDIYNSARDAARALGADFSTIYACLRGVARHTKGYISNTYNRRKRKAMSEDEKWIELDRMAFIRGYPNYVVYSSGTVMNIKTMHEIKPSAGSGNNQKINLYRNGVRKTVLINRIVAQAFLPDWDERYQVIPIDEDKTNHAASNLKMSKHFVGEK